MSVFDAVLASLQSMSQLQLLLAFMACTAYVAAQGALVSAKGRRIAWSVSAVSVASFAFESTQWVYAAMLATFAVAGLGLFVASAWLLSRALGLSRQRAAAEAAELAKAAEAEDGAEPPVGVDSPPVSASMPLASRPMVHHSGPAHSV